MVDKLKQLKKEITEHVDQTETAIDAFVLRLERFLGKNLRQILKKIKASDETTRLRGLRAAQALGGIMTTLEKKGLLEELKELDKIYGRQLRKIDKELGSAPERESILNDADFNVTEALVNFDASKVATRIETYVGDISAITMRGVITGDVPDFDDLTDTLGSRLVSNLKTELSTSVMAFYQTVSVQKAQEDEMDLFLYIGPDDEVTRPFCQEIVDKVFSLEQIRKMDNGQGLDVLNYRGGYNCRHHWRAVTEELAKQLGWDGRRN